MTTLLSKRFAQDTPWAVAGGEAEDEGEEGGGGAKAEQATSFCDGEAVAVAAEVAGALKHSHDRRQLRRTHACRCPPLPFALR